MKIQLLAVVSGVLLFAAACTQTSVDPSTTSTSLASARIGVVSNSTSTSATSTSTSSGTCVKGGNEVTITAAQLPATVLAYLASNFAGYTLVQAEQGKAPNGATYYEVKFTVNGTTKQLHFDMTGAVIADGKGGGNHGKGPSGNPEVVITKDQLPAATLTYLSANYAGYTFVQAEKGTDPKGVTYYEVSFTLNGKSYELHFDAAGALKK